MIRAVLRILFYLALAPLIGMLAGNLAIGATTQDFAFGLSVLDPQNLRLSYTIGLAPALLTAIVALVLARAYRGWRYWLWIGFGGASLSMALAWVVFGTTPLASGINPFLFSGVIAFAGGVAGFVCALLFDLIEGLVRRPG